MIHRLGVTHMCDRTQRYEDLELDVRSGYIEFEPILGFRTRPFNELEYLYLWEAWLILYNKG